jgi:P4 family phage/plasmid primase-like protien
MRNVEQPTFDIKSDYHRVAREWAALGFMVLPCHQDSKKPALSWRDQRPDQGASSDPNIIDRWWSQNPNYNVAVIPASANCVVLDLDLYKPGADATLLEKLPPTFRIRTPSGGLHCYYATTTTFTNSNARLEAELGPGIDVRSGNGYVLIRGHVVDPDPRRTGDYSLDLAAPIAALPDHIVGLLVTEAQAREQQDAADASFEWNTPAVPVTIPVFDADAAIKADLFQEDPDRSHALMSFVVLAKHKGATPEAIVQAVIADPHVGSKFNGRIKDARRHVEKCWHKVGLSEQVDVPCHTTSAATDQPSSGGALGRAAQPATSLHGLAAKLPPAVQPEKKTSKPFVASQVCHLLPLFCAEATDRFLLGEELGWLEYRPERGWTQSTGNKPPSRAVELAKTIVHRVAITAPGLSSSTRRSVASAPTVNGVLQLARGAPNLRAPAPVDWDADPFALNTPAGVIDLKTGDLRPRTPQDHHLRCCAVSPTPGPTPYFDQLLNGLADERADVADYIMRHASTLLTGNPDQRWWFIYGTGANGKSTFIELLAYILNGYAVKIPAQVLSSTQHDLRIDFETAFAPLHGKRLAYANETENGAKWNMSTMKELSGSDTITARWRYGHPFTFTPTHKCVAIGNHRPALDPDPATRRRYIELDCTRTFPAASANKALPSLLRAEAPHILHRLIQVGVTVINLEEMGCDGLQIPECIRAATAAVFDKADPTTAWRQARCEFHPAYKASITALWGSFSASVGPTNPFASSREFVAHLQHACPGVTRIDKSVRIDGGTVCKALAGIRLKEQIDAPAFN